MKYVLSYGGGVNSSALFFHLLDNNRPIDLVIHADTGEEQEHTHKAVIKMKEICKEKNIKFVIVQSDKGRLVNYYYKNKAVPSIMRRDCTSKFKIQPIRQYLRKEYGKDEKFVVYIGISSEEYTRMRRSDVKYIINSFPFCDDEINREENLRILEEHNFKTSKSGCTGCMFQKLKEWEKLFKDDIKTFDRWQKLEENNSRYPYITLTGRKITLKQLKERFSQQTSLNDWKEHNIPCNVAGGCFL